MPLDHIHVKGAREHNLKNIDVRIPRDKMVVITGLSGSGKSSLAFDTIYAEGQRRYVESLSAYARQFLGQMEKPDVDVLEVVLPGAVDDELFLRHNRPSLARWIGSNKCSFGGRETRSGSRETVQPLSRSTRP